jgi:outer membrane lipoprotein carrier protein
MNVFALACLGIPYLLAAAAGPSEVDALVERVQTFYEKTQDFTAEFKQDYTYKAFKRTQTSSGKVLYKRGEKGPKMRWDYEKPSAKSFVLAEDKVRLYDPEALSLTISAMATDKLSASVSFLWGQGKLAREFNIAKKECGTCKGTLLELNPKNPDPRFRQVLLEVDPKTAQVLKSTVVDPDGSQNVITFTSLKTNSGVTDDAFKLQPKAGTQIVDLTAGVAPVPAKDGGR